MSGNDRKRGEISFAKVIFIMLSGLALFGVIMFLILKPVPVKVDGPGNVRSTSKDLSVTMPIGPSIPRNVAVIGFSFEEIHVKVGTTVTWKNIDDTMHTVVAKDASFDSGSLNPGTLWSHTFTKTGTYDYHCHPHPWMTGRVVVER